MPRHNYIGTQSKDSPKIDKYFETVVTFDEINNNPKIDQIHKPNYQGSLIENKVEEMITEYLNNPLFLKIKNKIVIGCLNKNWYIIDGQHRLEMGKILANQHNINDKLHFCWFECNNEKDMKELFVSLNHDSVKNEYYIQSEDFEQVISMELTQKFKDHCKCYFSKKLSDHGKKKTIEEFISELRDHTSVFKDYDNSQDIYNFIMNKNKDFYGINRYEITFANNKSTFYVEEEICIKDRFIIPLKRNNFIQWLNNPDQNQPYHDFKKAKSSISNYKKQIVWKKEFQDSNIGTCPIKYCDAILRKGVKHGWECGHIISEYNGGITEPCNLRPICSKCNRDMGKTNWEEWEDKL